jgi:hypothetical protein
MILDSFSQENHYLLIADRFKRTVPDYIYGAVTTGNDWKFLKLCDRTIFIDKNDYFIKEVDKILGILTMTLTPTSETE